RTARLGSSLSSFHTLRPRSTCGIPLSRITASSLRFNSTLPIPTPPKTWVDRLPPKMRPYMYLTRIDKPIGTLLLFYPCGQFRPPLFPDTNLTPHAAWSISMSSYALHLPLSTPLTYISLCGIGALVMRGAGCTINDMWDKNLDKSVGASQPVH